MRKKIIIVTGMHRSGTSALTKSLNLLGCGIPRDLIPAQPDNPAGFFESKKIKSINDFVLSRLNSSWYDPLPLSEDWFSSEEAKKTQIKLSTYLNEHFEENDYFVIKDPRISKLLPLWKKVLKSLDAESFYIIASRNVLEIALSLNKRDNFSINRGILLALSYWISADKKTRGENRSFFWYENLLQSPETALENLAESLNITWPIEVSEKTPDLIRFISEDMRHHKADESLANKYSLILELNRLNEVLKSEDDVEIQNCLVDFENVLFKKHPLFHLFENERSEEWNEQPDQIHYLRERFQLSQFNLTENNKLLNSRNNKIRQLEKENQTLQQTLRVQSEKWRRNSVDIESLFSEFELFYGNFDYQEHKKFKPNDESSYNSSINRCRLLLNKSAESFLSTHLTLRENYESYSKLEHKYSQIYYELMAIKNSPFWKKLSLIRSILNRLLRNNDNYKLEFPNNFPFFSNTRFLKVSGWFADSFGAGARKVWIKIGSKRIVCKQLPRPDLSSILSKELFQSNHGFEAEFKVGNGIKLIHIFAERYDGVVVTLNRYLSFFSKNLTTENIIVAQPETPPSERYMFAFISGCPGDAYRYRCEHCSSVLNYLGYHTKVYPPGFFDFYEILETARIVIVHRLPYGAVLEQFIRDANEKGITVIFETDDLIFEPKLAHKIDAFNQMKSKEKKLYLAGLKSYRKAMGLFNGFMVSTEHLKSYAHQVFPKTPIAVRRNIVSEKMQQLAKAALRNKCNSNAKSETSLYIAYFSGTKTHDKDFEQCIVPLQHILRDFPSVKLMLVGHIDIPEKLRLSSNQIEHIPYMKWEDLPLYYTRVAINLSPLEPNNEFTLSKSELKFLEASLVGVPTIATKMGAFEFAIEHGKDGMLCENSEDWYTNLKLLIENPDIRKRLGTAAALKIQYYYLPKSSSTRELEAWTKLLAECSQNDRSLLKINWLLQAPIAESGGSHKLIFQFGDFLGQQGHEITFYIERIAHLEGKSQTEVIDFCHKYFDCRHLNIKVDHNNIQESDVTIATNWPTAYTLNTLNNTLLKAYFVADFEPEFYKIDDPNHKVALDTYDFPFLIVTLGRYLSIKLGERNNLSYPSVDFSLNEAFFAHPNNLNRHANLSQSASILFFARPNSPQRNMPLGVEALTELKRLFPKIQIILYGMEEKPHLPFEYKNLGIISQEILVQEMQKSNFHLSLSETNIKPVILEAMACGCISIELDLEPISTMVNNQKNCVLVQKSPNAIAKRILDLINNPGEAINIANNGYNSAKHLNTQNASRQLGKILKNRLFM